MRNMNSNALAAATVSVIWFVVLVTIGAELVAPLKSFLANVTGHHWVSKGVFAVVVFVTAYLIAARFAAEKGGDERSVYAVVGSAVAGGLGIFLFFVWHFFA